MSDAILPPPRSSSAAPATEASNRSDSSSGEGEFDTSLDQSFDSGAKEEGLGGFEARAENKQKRKRTSPQDQAILEAEYKQNPKPNKAARAEIVEKVSLNEKEVQIWFQNRRQINRRKSRPLLPHEIAAFGLGGMAALSSDPASMLVFNSSQTVGEPGPSSQQERSSSQESCQEEPEAVEPKAPSEPAKPIEQTVQPLSDPAITLPATLEHQTSSGYSLPETISTSVNDNVIKSFSSTPGYLANRWNSVSSSFSTPASSQPAQMFTPPITQASQPASCPERIDETASTPASRIRLSLSLDGKAELVTSSPSPPHHQAPRPSSSSASSIPQKRIRTLQRSQSALPFGHRSSSSSSGSPFLPRLPTGRSRDARTWEFCCDGEVRDELTAHAENESHGSAVAAISLIRSASNSALKSNANKRNAPAVKPDSAKYGKKPKLGRALSSLARLQNPGASSSKLSPDPNTFSKDGLMRSPSGDSDKENWVPHEGGGGNRTRRPLPSSRPDKQANPRAVLGDNHNVPTHATNFGGRKNRKRAPVETNIFEDQENTVEVGEEVEKFMRGEVSPSKKGDLDCIQGLLSLSQGNWR
ncbi:uncharacterized protein LY89DRAFT_680839 [Mollisia scopiformis]|uniref:Homeobox domain-containing protein n=1 Tax=Mollisia scopiformis TaxID=149040 RepID=A0A194XR05_MOLSC|nr:uncharacterized protein LY89DRAFT_680839 [Mollisia scopiformis]KUJ22720.1 hypothetical protein LY89DRAFT_680839 [Mollisia scopiformis]